LVTMRYSQVKAALEAEAMQIAIDLQERFLVDVTGVLGTLHQVQREAQHVAVVAAHQLLEGSAAACLGFSHQTSIVKLGQRSHRGQSGPGTGSLTQPTCQSQSRKRHDSLSVRA
jgi:hypothetical protein